MSCAESRRSSLQRRTRRRPKNCRSNTSAISTPASCSNRTTRAWLQLLPGVHEGGPDLEAGSMSGIGCRGSKSVPSSLVSSRHSTAPPLGTRWPSRRAGNTRVSLATRRSAGLKKTRQVADAGMVTDAGRSIQDQQARLAAGEASCAISSSGRPKSKSANRCHSSVTPPGSDATSAPLPQHLTHRTAHRPRSPRRTIAPLHSALTIIPDG